VSSTTFERVVEHSGLSPIFARSVIRRTVERAGLSAERLRVSEVEALLPELERALSAFLGTETPNRINKIRQVLKLGD
jgi:hypothetical protein